MFAIRKVNNGDVIHDFSSKFNNYSLNK